MYASVWKRFFAFMIDAAVFVILFWVLAQVLDNATVSIILLVIIWLYYALLESSPLQASLGKMIMGIKVVDRRGRRMSFWQATERILSKIVTNVTFYFGFFIAAFDKKKQTLHDRISHSMVVVKNKEFDPDDFVEAEEDSLTLVTIVSILLALVFVLGLLTLVALPQYKSVAERVQITRMAGILNQVTDHHQMRVADDGADPRVWHDSYKGCELISPQKLNCKGYELVLIPAGVRLDVRTPGMDILYSLFKPYDGTPVTCEATNVTGQKICDQMDPAN